MYILLVFEQVSAVLMAFENFIRLRNSQRMSKDHERVELMTWLGVGVVMYISSAKHGSVL